MIKNYSKKEVDIILESGEKLYLYFYSEGCGPCKTTTPIVEDFALRTNNVFKIPAKANSELETHLRVNSYPTLVVISDQVIERVAAGGLLIKSITKHGKSN